MAISESRPSNPEVENENLRVPAGDGGKAPRPATEPPGEESSVRTPKTQTDPGSGEPDQAAWAYWAFDSLAAPGAGDGEHCRVR
ncbi:hypothetical protein CSW58_09260 [Caulobacter sp. B11]|uniref:hypothetical protein n=1 Tax=Caulobacter sp. B11 TaxID=2048899 RepID=UPI000C12D0E2|nr:hypothetical protein [Caulobacter sp. B11]PHY12947.1 hypothetical protein CSW58_09260 [Caulobacter sp. B11]